ncbi:hypothetical protein B0G83_10636 [Paraburkholderia sp. BL21I4N1]|nr:hypothetical protein B0G83_10636 [Paraburkholderia sp. BL21I4N1]
MIKRSVSTAVGRFRKVNVVKNVGKMQMRQIVGDSAYRVDCPFMADACPLGLGRRLPARSIGGKRVAAIDIFNWHPGKTRPRSIRGM